MRKFFLIIAFVAFPLNSFAWYTELDNPDIRIDRSKVTTYAGDFHIPFKNPNLDIEVLYDEV